MSQTENPGRGRVWAYSLGLFALVWLVFGRTAGYGFLGYDDDLHVWKNPYIFPWRADCQLYFWTYPFHRAPLAGMPVSEQGVAWPFQLIYTPLSFMLLSLLAILGAPPGAHDPSQLSAVPFHCANLALHGLNAVLLFQLLRLWFPARASWLAAALFAVHPAQVEAVAWVTGLNNLLGCSLAFGALLLYFKAAREKEQNEASKSGFRMAAATLLFALSLLSKPSTIVLAPFALGLDWYLYPKTWKKRIPALASWLVLAAAASVLNASLRTSTDLGLTVSPALRLFVTTDSLAFYGAKTLFPWPLVPDYGRRPTWVVSQWWGYVTGLAPLLLGLALLWRARWKRASARGVWLGVLTAYLLWIVTLLPTSGLVPYYFQSISTVADRYLYVSLVPAVWALALVLSQTPLRLQKPLVGLVLTFAVYSCLHTAIWKDDKALWDYTLRHSARSWLARLHMATEAGEAGDADTRIRLMKEAAALRPDDWLTSIALADALYETGHRTEARPVYKKAIENYGGIARARQRYGELLESAGDTVGAANQYYMGTKIEPGNPELNGELGTMLVRMKQWDHGREYLEKALRLGYSPAKGHLALGIAAGQQNQLEEATRQFRLSLAADKDNYQAKYNLALALRALGQTADALRMAKEALDLKPDSKPAQALLQALAQARPSTAGNRP